jgi:protein-L-isoaspartate(D-aspartate) O-methyltransferase
MQLTLLLFIPNIMSYFFRAQGRNQRDLVEQLVRNGVVSSPEVRKAMAQVNRKNYVNDDNEEDAYIDTPLPIGCGQTISAPHMHATALEQMLPYLKKKNTKGEEEKKLSILDVGCGSGYLTAALGRLVDDSNGKQPIVGKGVWY